MTEGAIVAEEKKQPQDFKDISVKRGGKSIIIPEGMPYRTAREWLTAVEKDEEETVSVMEPVTAFALDGANAFARALMNIYGFVSQVATPTFFGPRPPVMIQLQTGVNAFTQVPWGDMVIPGIEGKLTTGAIFKEGLWRFCLRGAVKKKNLADVRKIVDETRRILREESVYHGKAIRAVFPDDEENFDPSIAPTFFETTIQESDLIFSKVVMNQVKTSLFTPIERTAECRASRVPLKRGILLEGPYGTGKTLLATVAAGKAVANNWTFIYLQNVADLPRAIRFAQVYQPAIIFAEDLDQVLGDVERSEEVNELLNLMDGTDTKNLELMVVLTTNNVDRIEPAMLRPGRLDAIISIRPPDAEAVSRLIRLYAGNLLAADANLDEASELLAGRNAAAIREATERAKLAAIGRTEPGQALFITGDDLVISAGTLMNHLRLLDAQNPDTRTNEERAADIVATGFVRAAETFVTGALGNHPTTTPRRTAANGSILNPDA